MNSPTQRKGYQAELWVVEQLRQRGHKTRLPDFFTPNCDIIVAGLPIEVKFAHPTRRANRTQVRWQFRVHPTAQQMTGEWAAVLVAQDEAMVRYAYIVPGSMFKDRTWAQITSHPTVYRGWLAKFLNRWDVIEYLSQETYRHQGPLLNQWAGSVAA